MEKRSILIICLGLSLFAGLSLLVARGIFGVSLAKIGQVFQDGSALVVSRTDKKDEGSSPGGIGKSETVSSAKALGAKAFAVKPALCVKTVAVPRRASIIINEVAWMGSLKSYSDEWIELKNISLDPVDLNGWQLQNKKQKIKIFFEPAVVAPGGLYLLERTDDESAPLVPADLLYVGSLANSNEALYLFDSQCVLNDQVEAASKWPAGDNISKKTMERTVNFLWTSSKEPAGTPRGENGAPLNVNVPAP
jgi:hypothetical protein